MLLAGWVAVLRKDAPANQITRLRGYELNEGRRRLARIVWQRKDPAESDQAIVAIIFIGNNSRNQSRRQVQ